MFGHSAAGSCYFIYHCGPKQLALSIPDEQNREAILENIDSFLASCVHVKKGLAWPGSWNCFGIHVNTKSFWTGCVWQTVFLRCWAVGNPWQAVPAAHGGTFVCARPGQTWPLGSPLSPRIFLKNQGLMRVPISFIIIYHHRYPQITIIASQDFVIVDLPLQPDQLFYCPNPCFTQDPKFQGRRQQKGPSSWICIAPLATLGTGGNSCGTDRDGSSHLGSFMKLGWSL